MDFALLPPEINSARMYFGPGSESMVVAAEAWEALASELRATADSYRSVIVGLTSGPWVGPSSASMMAAASSYANWLNRAVAQAEESGIHAKAAVAAYEDALASTVPPQLVAANRATLTRLIATNLFGRNMSAIITIEAQYAEIWAQDAAAMYRYAGSSAAAAAITPFESPGQNTTSSGEAGQAAAVVEATGTSAGHAQRAMSAIPIALQSLSAPAQLGSASSSLDTLSDLVSIFLDLPSDVGELTVDVPLSLLGIVSLPLDIGGYGTGVHTDEIVSGWAGERPWPDAGPAPVKEFPAPLANLRPGAVPLPRVSAGVGEANAVGALSVPSAWSIATPAVRPISYVLPALPAALATPEDGATLGSSSTLGRLALAGLAGRAIAGTLGAGAVKGTGPALGERARSVADAATSPEDPAADGAGETPESTPRAVVVGVAAELREFSKLHDEGILTDDEYAEQKNRLLGR